MVFLFLEDFVLFGGVLFLEAFSFWGVNRAFLVHAMVLSDAVPNVHGTDLIRYMVSTRTVVYMGYGIVFHFENSF